MYYSDPDSIYAAEYTDCYDSDSEFYCFLTYLVPTDRFYDLHRDLVSFCHQHGITPWSIEDLDAFILDPYVRHEMRTDPLLTSTVDEDDCADFWLSFWDACISRTCPTHTYSRFTEVEHFYVPLAV